MHFAKLFQYHNLLADMTSIHSLTLLVRLWSICLQLHFQGVLATEEGWIYCGPGLLKTPSLAKNFLQGKMPTKVTKMSQMLPCL